MSYNASCAPLEILRDGKRLIDDAAKNVVAGQMMELTVTGADSNTTYSWAIPAGTFKNYDGNKSIDPNKPNDLQLSFLQPSDCTNSLFDFYWIQGKGDERTVSCNVLVDGKSVSVTGKLTVLKIESSLTADWGGDVRFDPDSINPMRLGLEGYDPHNGIDFSASATSPSAAYKGDLTLVQLVTPHRYVKLVISGVPSEYISDDIGKGIGLDTLFPYCDPFPMDQANPEVSGDNPGFKFNTPQQVAFVATGDDANPLIEPFTVYLMYKPPVGANNKPSCWVPLRKLDWSWIVSASHDASWQIIAPDKNKGGSTETDQHPQWKYIALGKMKKKQ